MKEKFNYPKFRTNKKIYLHIVLCIGLVNYCVKCHDDCLCAFVLQPKTLIGTFEDHKENKKGRKEIK
jgi:hypothetical protein